MLYYIVILKFVAEETLTFNRVPYSRKLLGFFFVIENIFERFIQLICPLLRESVKVKPPVHINILSEISREVTRLVKFSINVFEHMYMLEP